MPLNKSILSVCTIKISLFFDNQELSTGSAFFYEYKGRSFVVTNRHNLTGRNQNTGDPLHSLGGIPNSLVFDVPTYEVEGDLVKFGNEVHKCSLPWEIGKNPWLEHPELGEKADVAAIDYHRVWPKAIKPFVHANTAPGSVRIVLQPAMRVSVVGYPFGQAVAKHYPVWVSGSLASEPDFDVGGKPAMFVDCRTNRGSSGSPVFAYYVNSPVQTEGKTVSPKPFMEYNYGDGRATGFFDQPVHRFIGIYSGRINDDADIGLVWRDEVIEAVCSSA